MKHSKSSLNAGAQQGVGLIDVLVGLVVISFGVLGLAQLQSVVMREGGSAKSRSVAVQLARAKLDDLRSYTQLADIGGTPGSACATAPTFCYTEIGANTGGAENADGTRRLPAGTLTVANTAYTRAWAATDYYYCGTGAAATTTNCSRPYADFKALTVTITWTDADGTTGSVSLSDTASSIDPLSGGRALLSGAGQPGPVVQYVPGEAPEVIAIDVGGGQKKETTNPVPTITKKGNDFVNTIARYETIRYSSTENTITRAEFATLNCLCKQDGNGTGYNLKFEEVGKRVGVPANNDQAFECTACCRDHHDNATCDPNSDTGRNNCFDPYRPASDYSNGDHNHYTANGQLANDEDDIYVESCRMIRADGFLRVTQDWRLLKVNAIPQSYFATDANIAAYGTYVKNLVTSALAGTTAPTGGWTTSQNLAVNAETNLLARGVYLDYLDSATKSALVSRINANDPTVFQELPFYEVNLTKLGQWSSGSNAIATVTNDQLKTEEKDGPEQYNRGKVKGVAPGTTNITVRARLSNTGVINEFITSDPDDSSAQTSSVAVTVGTFYTVSGSVSGLAGGSNLTVAGIGSGGSANVSCSVTSGSPDTFSCLVPPNWSGSITPSATGYSFSPTVVSLSNVTANNGTLSFTGTGSVSANRTISGTAGLSPGTTITALGSGGNANGSCTYDGVNGSYACLVPDAWSGSIVPAACGYSFSPASYVASNVTGDTTVNFTPTASGASALSVSGTILAAPTVATVTVTASGSGTSCTYTSATGAYTCTVPACWAGTVTPSAGTGITFSPTAYSYPNVSSSLSNQNFNTSYQISGTVGQVSGSWLTGVVFTATGSGGSPNGTCTYPDVNGTYSCIVPGLWNGSVMPTKTGYSFSPTSRSYTNVTSTNVTENYTAVAVVIPNYTITVAITGLKNSTANGAGVVAVTGLACGSAVVSGTGSNRTATISCTVQQGWNGTVTPSNLGASTTSPANQAYSNVTSNQSVSFACSGAC